MARHETYNAIMNTGVGWAAMIAGIAFLAPDNYKIIIATVASVAFYVCVGVYFYFDYRKSHRKRKPKIKFPSLSTETVEPEKTVTHVRTKWTIVGTVLILIVETFESVFFILAIVTWQTFTVSDVPVLTYQNLILICVFILGVFLAIDVGRRVRSKKAFFGED